MISTLLLDITRLYNANHKVRVVELLIASSEQLQLLKNESVMRHVSRLCILRPLIRNIWDSPVIDLSLVRKDAQVVEVHADLYNTIIEPHKITCLVFHIYQYCLRNTLIVSF